jgi:hypothetical protein
MALTKSSVLHYWSSRYGINPRVGGRPVFTRNSAGLFTTQEGEVDVAIVNTPRFDWATLNLPGGLTERRKVLTLELARSNRLVAPSDFSNAAWVKTSMTVTTGIADPAGGTSACTLTATAGPADLQQALSGLPSSMRTASFYLRRRTGVGAIQILKADGFSLNTIVLTSNWQRFDAPSNAAAVTGYANVRITTSGDAIDAWLGDLEDGPFVTSGIVAGSGASRAADSFYWNFPPVPQAMMLYHRFVEQMSGDFSASLFEIAGAAHAAAYFMAYRDNAFTGYRLVHQPAGTNVIAQLTTFPLVGDTCEHGYLIASDGSVRIIQSINGAAVTDSGFTAALALAAAWNGPRLWLGKFGDGTYVGSQKSADFKVVKYADVVASTAQGIMDELRAFELGPNGDIL